jgi:hypothetical protein
MEYIETTLRKGNPPQLPDILRAKGLDENQITEFIINHFAKQTFGVVKYLFEESNISEDPINILKHLGFNERQAFKITVELFPNSILYAIYDASQAQNETVNHDFLESLGCDKSQCRDINNLILLYIKPNVLINEITNRTNETKQLTIAEILKSKGFSQRQIEYFHYNYFANELQDAIKQKILLENKQEKLDGIADIIKTLDTPINTIFGIYVGAQLTIMLSTTVFPNLFGFVLSLSFGYALLGIIVFNILFDMVLYQLFEGLLRSSSFLQKIFGDKLNKKSKENFKFFILAITAIICISIGCYYIPAALLIFSAAYFVNYYLQSGALTNAIRKLFLTVDKATGEWSVGMGYKYVKFKLPTGQIIDVILTNFELNIIKFATVFSAFFGIAMAALFAKWVFPLLISATFLGTMASPLGIAICAGLVIYGITYSILTASAWGDLIQLNHAYQQQFGKEIFIGYGIFSPHAIRQLFSFLWKDFSKFCDEAIITFFWRIIGISYVFVKGRRLEGLGELILGLTQFIVALITLCWRLAKFAICIIAPYGMWSALDKASIKLAAMLEAFMAEHVATGIGSATTWINSIAKGPFIIKSAFEQLANIFNDVTAQIESSGNYLAESWKVVQTAIFGKELCFSHFVADLYRWCYGSNGFLATDGILNSSPEIVMALIGAFSQATTTSGKAASNFKAKPQQTLLIQWSKTQTTVQNTESQSKQQNSDYKSFLFN